MKILHLVPVDCRSQLLIVEFWLVYMSAIIANWWKLMSFYFSPYLETTEAPSHYITTRYDLNWTENANTDFKETLEDI